MNKATAFGLGLVGIIGAAVAPLNVSYSQEKKPYLSQSAPATSAQVQSHPIKFGKDRKLEYTLSTIGDIIEPRRPEFMKTTTPDQNFGKVYIGPGGAFEMWGMLDGTRFHYMEDFNERILHLGKNNVEIKLVDVKNGFVGRFGNPRDYAYIGVDYVDLGYRNFFEDKKPKYDQYGIYPRLHSQFWKFHDLLNVSAVKAEAEKKKTPPEQLPSLLDTFSR